MDLNNPFGTRAFDPSTGRRIDAGVTQPLIAEGRTQAEPKIEGSDGLEWENLKPQERAIWASVFGVAYNHALVCGDDEDGAYCRGEARARGAVQVFRKYHG